MLTNTFLDGVCLVDWCIQMMDGKKQTQTEKECQEVRKQEEPVRDKCSAMWFEENDKLDKNMYPSFYS